MHNGDTDEFEIYAADTSALDEGDHMVLQLVCDTFAEVCDRDPAELDADSDLIDDVFTYRIFDEIDEMLRRLRMLFPDVHFSDQLDELANQFDTIGDVVAYIKEQSFAAT